MSDDHANPYESPKLAAVAGITSRQLVFALIFGVVVLGGVISVQVIRQRRLQEAAAQAMMRAEAARAAAEQAQEEAQQAKAEAQEANAALREARESSQVKSGSNISPDGNSNGKPVNHK